MSNLALPERADVVIVGGGVMGASAAFHLAEAGVSVVLLERGALAGGSTSKAAGGVRANFSDPLNIALGARSLDLLADFESRPGAPIDLHRPGYLFLLSTQEQMSDFEAATALQQSMGLPTRMIDAAEIRALNPLVNVDDLLGGAFSPTDGHCTPEAVVHGYAAGARRHGAVVITDVEVVGITLSGNDIRSVQTTAGEIKTDVVLCCAGAWSPTVAAMVGVELPVTPYRREIAITEPLPAGEPWASLPAALPMTIDATTSFYHHREGPALLMGFSDPSTAPGFDLSRDPAFADGLGERIAGRAPAILDLGIASGWAGLYEVTPDHNALLGESRSISRFLYATGFSGHGFLQGPAIGEWLRDRVMGRTPAIDVAALDVERFASGQLRPERHVV